MNSIGRRMAWIALSCAIAGGCTPLTPERIDAGRTARDGTLTDQSGSLDAPQASDLGADQPSPLGDSSPRTDVLEFDLARDLDLPDEAFEEHFDARLSDGPMSDGPMSDAVADGLAADALSADSDLWRFPNRELCLGDYLDSRVQGVLGDADLRETSGIVPSPTRADVLWLHNDSGDTARLFALRNDGSPLGRLRLPGVRAFDFEDIAAARCPHQPGPCLFVADIGNNRLNRPSQFVYAVPEPSVDPNVPFGEIDAVNIAAFPFTIEGTQMDTEAIVVPADGSTFYLFEKVDADQARVFRHPGLLVPGASVPLTVLPSFNNPGVQGGGGRLITGASLHPSGERLAIRVYSGLFEYTFADGGSLERLSFATIRLVALNIDHEPQGEAVTYDFAGTGLITVSEDPFGTAGRELHHHACDVD